MNKQRSNTKQRLGTQLTGLKNYEICLVDIFNESFFAIRQLETNFRLLFTTSSSSVRLRLEKLVSSAKMWKSNNLLQLLKSLIYKRNRRGPSTDPCGTPWVTTMSSDLVLPIETCCLLIMKIWSKPAIPFPRITIPWIP